MDALIVGAGLSGCLSALMLKKAGATCRVIDSGSRDSLGFAADHAHRFKPEDLDDCATLLGVPSWELASCGRASLLRRLRSAVEGSSEVLWEQRLESLSGALRGWKATVASHSLDPVERVIDASGGSYAAAEMATRTRGGVLKISHLEDRWIYNSWRLISPDLQPRGAELGSGFILVGNDGGEVLVTAAVPAEESCELEAMSRHVEQALGLERGALHRTGVQYGGSALTRSHISSDCAGLGVGDALVRTPPRFGDGLHHALETARCASLSSIAEASQSLARYADQIWSGTTLAMAFEKAHW